MSVPKFVKFTFSLQNSLHNNLLPQCGKTGKSYIHVFISFAHYLLLKFMYLCQKFPSLKTFNMWCHQFGTPTVFVASFALSSSQHISSSSGLEQQTFSRSPLNSRLATMQHYNAVTAITNFSTTILTLETSSCLHATLLLCVCPFCFCDEDLSTPFLFILFKLLLPSRNRLSPL